MNFKPELAEKVMAGEKTVTRRLVSDNPNSPWWVDGCSLKVGRTYAVCPGRGKNAIGRALVTAVEKLPLGYLTDEEARAEGFADEFAFRDVFHRINGYYDPDAEVWRVALERVEAEPEQLALAGSTGGDTRGEA